MPVEISQPPVVGLPCVVMLPVTHATARRSGLGASHVYQSLRGMVKQRSGIQAFVPRMGSSSAVSDKMAFAKLAGRLNGISQRAIKY